MRLFLFSLVLFFNVEAFAMKPYFPEEMEFFSDDHLLRLHITKEKTATVQALNTDGKVLSSNVLSGTLSYPSEVAISSNSGLFYLLGGHGDPGGDTGSVLILNADGAMLHSIDLRESIKNLEDMASAWKGMGNFPWISQTNLSESGYMLSIEICEQFWVDIDAKAGTVVRR